jgi:hypothetical protein
VPLGTSPGWGVCAPWIDLTWFEGDPDWNGDQPACGSVAPLSMLNYIDVASELLYQMTARQWPGLCRNTVRPYRRPRRYDGPPQSSVDVPYGLNNPLAGFGNVGGMWLWDASWGLAGSGYDPMHSPDSVPAIPCVELPGEILSSIVSVKVDGVALPGTSYHVDDWRYLCRDDGLGWPWGQDLRLDSTHVGTWEIDYYFGANPPISGQHACAVFACQLALASVGDATCQLPRRTQQIVRQGVTTVQLSIVDLVTMGRTGLLDVDMFISAANPGNLTEAPVIVTPDVTPPAGRRTWSSGG